MPVDLNGYWKMISNDNFEEYLKALGEFGRRGWEGPIDQVGPIHGDDSVCVLFLC